MKVAPKAVMFIPGLVNAGVFDNTRDLAYNIGVLCALSKPDKPLHKAVYFFHREMKSMAYGR